MRTDDERISAMHRRAAELKIERRHVRVRVIQTASAVCCCAAVILLAVMVPGISGMGTGSGNTDMNASLFANSPFLGYAVIGIIAFALGITVTVLCYQMKRWQDKKDSEDMQC